MEGVADNSKVHLHVQDEHDGVNHNNEGEADEASHLNIHYDNLILLDKKILCPYKYLTSNPGKNFRQTLCSGLNHWLKAPEEIVRTVSKVAFLMHHSSLMLDDIQDESKLRRGLPCAHLVYGSSNTINATSFLVAEILRTARTLNNVSALRVTNDLLMDSLRGQTMDIFWRDHYVCPTEEEYEHMVLQKTGYIFNFTDKVLQLFSTTHINTTSLVKALTMYFQINDDYQNLNNEMYHHSKGYCEDISEGKFGFPIIYVVHNFPKEGKQIIDILREHTFDLRLKKYCRSIIEKCGGFEYTKNVLSKYKKVIEGELEKLEPNPFLNKLTLGIALKIDF